MKGPPSRLVTHGVCETVDDLAAPLVERCNGAVLVQVETAQKWVDLWIARGEPRADLAGRLAMYRARLIADMAASTAAHVEVCGGTAPHDPSIEAYDRGARIALAASGRTDAAAVLADAGIAP